jgi:hypothetical protein
MTNKVHRPSACPQSRSEIPDLRSPPKPRESGGRFPRRDLRNLIYDADDQPERVRRRLDTDETATFTHPAQTA